MRIAIIQGHPDPAGGHLCHALAERYAQGVRAAGHEVSGIDVAGLEFPVLRTREEWENPTGLPADIRMAQETISRADHLLIIYPLWLGTMPALLKAFLEQVLRPGFAIGISEQDKTWSRLLTGKSARVVVTMGMPALLYRWYFRAHSLKSLERNILRFCGIGPIRESLIGLVENLDEAGRDRWLSKMQRLGHAGR